MPCGALMDVEEVEYEELCVAYYKVLVQKGLTVPDYIQQGWNEGKCFHYIESRDREVRLALMSALRADPTLRKVVGDEVVKYLSNGCVLSGYAYE